MKTKEELNALRNEYENMSKILAEPSEDELKEVTGGDILENQTRSGNIAVVCSGGIDGIKKNELETGGTDLGNQILQN